MRLRTSRMALIAAVLTAAGLLPAGLTATPADAKPPSGGRTVATGTTTTVSATGTSDVPAPVKPKRVKPLAQTAPASATASAAATAPAGSSGTAAPGGGTGRTLVLYDTTGPYAWLGEVYATQIANLASHYGSWVAQPVAGYTAGELSGYGAVVYVGSTYDEPVPTAFLDDVTATSIPVVWIYDNIWQLTARDPNFAATRGFTWQQFDFSSVAEVDYQGTALTRDATNGAGIMDDVVSDPTKATVVGTAVRADGTSFPWAVRSGNFTYVGEVPFAYITHDDRYLAFADLLNGSLGGSATTPAGPVVTRHRALVRIEDVGPDADPTELRAVADYLYSRHAPFTVAVYPRYRDPSGVNNNGVPEDYTLAQRPKVVSALKYLQSHGGTLLMHGYTHQYGNVANPYNAVSADDFEFYRAHIDAANNVVYDGPVAEDSVSWAAGRMSAAASAFSKAGLAVPTMFEFPHYAGSALDYQAANALFSVRYDRGLYFPGALTGAAPDYTRMFGQFFPYPVRDVYGTAVVPENLGNVEPEWFNNHPPRLPVDILASAQRNLVVRDGTASFFYHPYLGTAYLRTIVEGIQGMGYTFVPAAAMLTG